MRPYNLEETDAVRPKLNPGRIAPTIVHDGKLIREASLICKSAVDCAPIRRKGLATLLTPLLGKRVPR